MLNPKTAPSVEITFESDAYPETMHLCPECASDILVKNNIHRNSQEIRARVAAHQTESFPTPQSPITKAVRYGAVERTKCECCGNV